MPGPINQIELLKSALPVKKGERIANTPNEEQLRKACEDFESIFVDYMMKQMRKTVTKSGTMGTSQAEQLYTSMLDSEVSKNVSQARGIGLATMMYNQMSTVIGDGPTKK